MEGMDKVDAKQQEEITALQKTDIKHDRDFLWNRILLIGVILGLLANFVYLMESVRKTDPFNCPHAQCEHHRSR